MRYRERGPDAEQTNQDDRPESKILTGDNASG